MSRNLAQLWDRPPRRSWEMDIPWRDPKQLIGIEVEVEMQGVVSLPDVRTIVPAWEKGSDGSLRNGYEYRLSSPLAGSQLSAAINQFFHPGVTLERALTSGTHIHIDMMEETTNVTSVQALVLLVYILEPAIFNIVDAGREWCGYTNGLETAPPVLIRAVLQDGLEDDPSELLKVTSAGKTYKYYGLNLMPLAKFGSVEFRYFPTATSSAELIDWIQMVQAFKVAAVTLVGKEGVSNVLANVSNYEDFIRSAFDVWSDRMLELVPYDLAVKRYRQALFTTHTNYGQLAAFDPAILRTKQFSKFARKANKLADQIASGLSPSDTLPMDVVVTCGRVADIMFARTDWRPWSIVVGYDATYIKHPDRDWVQFNGSNGSSASAYAKNDPRMRTEVLPYKAMIVAATVTQFAEARLHVGEDYHVPTLNRVNALAGLLTTIESRLQPTVPGPAPDATLRFNVNPTTIRDTY